MSWLKQERDLEFCYAAVMAFLVTGKKSDLEGNKTAEAMKAVHRSLLEESSAYRERFEQYRKIWNEVARGDGKTGISLKSLWSGVQSVPAYFKLHSCERNLWHAARLQYLDRI